MLMLMVIYVSGDTQVGRRAALRSMDASWLLQVVVLLTEPAKRPGGNSAGKRELSEFRKRH
jgi:hypothetical protein